MCKWGELPDGSGGYGEDSVGGDKVAWGVIAVGSIGKLATILAHDRLLGKSHGQVVQGISHDQ
jgi:hypothetical protein